MKKAKTSSKLLAVLLAMVMMLGLLPMTALAAGDGEISILLSYFNMDDDDGFPIARRAFTVAPGLSEEYGYVDAYYGTAVTALDAIVAAHIAVFGDNEAEISAKLTVSSSGWITNFMGIGTDFTFFVNGVLPGAGAGSIRLSDGDVVEFFAMQDDFLSGDAYVWFELGGSRVDEISVGADVPFPLTIVGIDWVIWGTGSGWFDAEPADFDEDTIVIDMLIDVPTAGAAKFGGSVIKEESDDGDVEIVFDTPGIYYLSATGDTCSNDNPIMAPWLKVTVTDSGDQAASLPVIVNPPPAPFTPGPATVGTQEALDSTLEYIASKQTPAPVYGDEWDILTLARGGYAVSSGYYEGYYGRIKAVLTEQDTNRPKEPGGGANQFTTNSRLVLALTAIGVDATDVEGYDLLAPFKEIGDVKSQGLNTAVYTLLAIDSKPYNGYTSEKNELIEYVLSTELSGGGFNWGYSSDIEPDMTGIVLQALAPYSSRQDVALVITRALAELSTVQEADGGYESWGAVSAENSAQVIVAAATLGLDPDSFRNQSGNNPMNSMLSFYMSGGGFQSGWAPGVVDVMATQQASYALVAYNRFKNQANSLYDMSDCNISLTASTGVDLTVLNTLISSAESKIQANYTVGSWDAMTNKLNAAIAVRDDSSATQAMVNQAASELNAAINALTLSSGGDGGVGQEITVRFKLIGDTGTWIDTKSYTFAGSTVTVYDLIIKALGEAGLDQEGADDGYVSGIKSPEGAWLRQFDKGSNSGWVYSVDGVFISRGIKTVTLSNGNTIEMSYTDDYTRVPGLNVGDGYSDTDKNTGTDNSVSVDVGANTDENSIAYAEISTSVISNLINKAKTEDASDIVISITNTDDAKSVEVDVHTESLKSISGNGMSLTINTGKATITFDSATLDSITSGNEDDAVMTITATIVDAQTELNARQQELVGDNPVIDLSVMVGSRVIHEFGGTVTVSVPYTPPQTVSSGDYDLLTVYYIDANGNIAEMIGAKYDAATGMITFSTDHFSTFFVSEWINPFSDISKSDWYYKAVRFAYTNGLATGTSTGTFLPNANMTRAMVVTMLYRMENGESVMGAVSPFSDVAAGEWYSDAIAWAGASGLANGYMNGTFGPNDIMTREQMATMLYRCAGEPDVEPRSPTLASQFADAGSVSAWAADAMNWAYANGLVSGINATTLAPLDPATRAEAAVLLLRLDEMHIA